MSRDRSAPEILLIIKLAFPSGGSGRKLNEEGCSDAITLFGDLSLYSYLLLFVSRLTPMEAAHKGLSDLMAAVGYYSRLTSMFLAWQR